MAPASWSPFPILRYTAKCAGTSSRPVVCRPTVRLFAGTESSNPISSSRESLTNRARRVPTERGGFPNGLLTQLWERPFDPSYSSRCRWGATHRCNRRPPASVSGSRGRLAQRRSRRRHQSAGLADPFVDSNAVLLARRVPSVGHEGLVTEGRKRRANQRSREISLSASSGPGRTPR